MTSALGDLKQRYLRAQLAGDRKEAVRLIVDGLAAGASVFELQHHVIASAQDEIGQLWQRNEVTIAQEHMATAISQLSLATLFERAQVAASIGKKILVACVQGEQHDLPARLAADALEIAGFDVRYLGANVPHDHLLPMIVSEAPDLVGLSVTMSFNVPALREAVSRLRATKSTVPIVAGGHALTWAPDLATQLDVHAAGRTPAELVALARRLTETAS